MEPLVKYKEMCIRCGKEISSEEIENNLCKNSGQKLNEDEKKEYIEFKNLFKEEIGSEPNELQRYWFYRFLAKENFSINAPTGFGKTSFGIILSAYYGLKGKKVYIIVPTTTILLQIIEKIPKKVRDLIAFYHSKLKKKEKEEMLEKIKNREFNILITTSAFLSKNYSYVEGQKFDLIFCDDLDSVLKSSQNLNKILYLLGFSLEEIKKREVKDDDKGQMIVATATAKKGKATQILRALLNLDSTRSKVNVREVYDTYIVDEPNHKVIEDLVQKLGEGILLYCKSEEEASKLYNYLKEKYKIGIVTSKEDKDLERFLKGELIGLVGVSHHYGKLVRGLDDPERIKYAIFYEIPQFKIKIKEIDELSEKLVLILLSYFSRDKEVKRRYYELINNIEEAKKMIKKFIEEGKTKEIKHFVMQGDEIIIPDVVTYIQASGRTSRLWKGQITKGLSVVIDGKEKIDALVQRSYLYDIVFQNFYDLDLEKVKKEIELSRKEEKGWTKKIVPALMIVESPTKAKQIARFYGKPSVKIINNQIFYEILTDKYLLLITASLGHVTELITKGFFFGIEIDENENEIIPWYDSIKKCENGFQFTDNVPKNLDCGKINDSRERINNIRELALATRHVIIATDPDPEGEKIAWDIKNLIFNNAKVYRAEFHEVTKKAIDESLKNLREIDTDLVKSQIVRRVEDRFIGFGLTKILREKFKDNNLSAGRVQTPVLGWIIEREKEFRKRKKKFFLSEGGKIILELPEEIDLKLKEVDVDVEIKEVEEVEEIIVPYTTDTILQDANRILKIGAKETMQILQNLFENGLITYHRTDSIRVSEKGLQIAKEYLEEDFVPRTFASSEGAHECIRPTRPIDREQLIILMKQGVIKVYDIFTKKHFAVYDLIFKRFMASQTESLKKKVAKVKITLKDGNNKIEFEKELVLDCKGKSYEFYKYVCNTVNIEQIKGRKEVLEKKVPVAFPYTQAEIISLMKKKKIGRPSTYSTIIEKLFQRKYVYETNQRLRPTKKGFIIYNFLSKNYSKYVSEETTAKVQEIMERVEKGELNYNEVLWDFYKEIKEMLNI